MMQLCRRSKKSQSVPSLRVLILYTFYVKISLKILALCIDTSGTTGAPKGVVRDTGGTVVALNWVMKNVFNIGKGDTWFAASDIGWVVGHSFIVYGPLIRGATSIIFEGKPIIPDAGVLWRVVEQHKVKSLYVAPTAVRVVKKDDYDGLLVKKYDTSTLQGFNLVGERCDPDTILWVHRHFPHVIINDNWW